MHIAFVGLGSNIEPEKYLLLAIDELRKLTKVLAISSVWRSPAFGTSGPDFLNAVAKLEIDTTAEDLKNDILRPIEEKLGRQRSQNKNAPRTIDLDVLIFDEEIADSHIWEYPHLAIPLAEFLPNLENPSSRQTISEFAQSLKKGGQYSQS